MTTRDPRHDVLFEPVTIGPKVLPNRFYAVPHSAGMGVNKPRSQAAFRSMKAEGGWGAVCTEFAPVSYDSDTSPSLSAHMWDDEDARRLQLMSESVHVHGALAGIELTHLGGIGPSRSTRWPLIAPSAVPIADPTAVPKAMDRDDLERVQRNWVDAARRARDVGFDIIYVMATDLPAQFLSPILNVRPDEFGGSLQNRARFFIETLQRVRDAVGQDCAVATRMGVAGLRDKGVTDDDILRLIEMADPLIDLWDVNLEPADPTVELGPSRAYPPGFQREIGAWVRQATAKPIVGVGRLTDPDLMVDIIKSGACDLIGGARPSIADPFLPAKIRDGRYDDIRECIGCNICARTAEFGAPHLSCTQNATAGEEYRRGWHPEQFSPASNNDRSVLVVGGGPAGMECAIVLAKRGFENVHLVEATGDLGGHMQWVPRLSGLATWGRVVEWRASQLDSMRNVAVIPNSRMDAEAVLDYGADLVVVATGATWSSEGAEGVDPADPRVLLPEDIMVAGRRPAGRNVVVYDVDGYFVGAGMAELLATEGYVVTFVTPGVEIAPQGYFTGEASIIRRRFHDLKIKTGTGLTAVGLGDGGFSAVNEFEERVDFAADGLVLVTRRQASSDLYDTLTRSDPSVGADGIENVFRIGDCVAPRLLADTIFDGHRLAREIDGPSPGVPIPHRREQWMNWSPLG